jgi:hypothetical protein
MKKLLFSLLAMFVMMNAFAQKSDGTLKGRLVESDTGNPISDATISIIVAADSSLLDFGLSDKYGNFEFRGLPIGELRLLASHKGMAILKKDFTLSAADKNFDLADIKMEKEFLSLGEVTVSAVPIKVSGDTISYKADYFKVKENANVEDLLKKLPGVVVEKDGAVKAQGEQVQRVYVNGKEFFSNDPKLATKNLRSDMIDAVEVFDDMSEQAKFNGIDDGSRTKAINLKLKADKTKGAFGKATVGAGDQGRYDASVSANLFKGARQVSIIGKANNTNNMGFSVGDMMNFFGGGNTGGGGDRGAGGGMQMVMRSGAGGAAGGMNLGATGVGGLSGITSSWNTGINYKDTWSKKLDVNGSYSYNHAATENEQNAFRQTFFTDSLINRSKNTISSNENNNHRLNFNMVYAIDSFTSLIYNPTVSLQSSRRFSNDTTSSFAETASMNYLLNDARTLNETEGDGFNWTNNLILRKRFRSKKGRTLSINYSKTNSENNRFTQNYSANKFFNNSGVKIQDRIQDQQTDVENTTNNYSIGASFTEPIGKNKVLEFNYSHNSNLSNSDNKTFRYNPTTGLYDIVQEQQTNHFENANTSDRFGANYRYIQKKYNFQIGMAVQQTRLESDNLTKNTSISQTFRNLFPNASATYQFSRAKNIRFNYRGRTNQPSINQLQPVPDITDPLNIKTGNPNLKQEFINNFSLNYTFFDIYKFKTMFAFVNFSNTQNKIVNSTSVNGFGVTNTMPINMNGTYAGSGNLTVGFPIKKLKGGNYTTTTRIMMNRDVNRINDLNNFTRNLTIGEDLKINYNLKSKLDIGVGASINYTQSRYTIQTGLDQNYFTHIYSADLNYQMPKGFVFAVDYDYTANTGRSEGFNQHLSILNASLAKQMFKKKNGEIRFGINDLLNQNISINRNVGDNYVEDIQSRVLRRFFIVGFTYNLNKAGAKTNQLPSNIERNMRNIKIMQ